MKPHRQFLIAIFRVVDDFKPQTKIIEHFYHTGTHREEQKVFQISDTFKTSFALHIKPQHDVYILM